VITETTFAINFASVWQLLTPNSESVIKGLNKTVLNLRRASFAWSRADRRAFVNEIGFELFAHRVRGAPAGHSEFSFDDRFSMAVAAAGTSLARFSFTSPQPDYPTNLERLEAMSLANGLHSFRRRVEYIARDWQQTCVHPRFRGCGILEACEGDLLIGDILVEVKSGDRNFRSIDIRQLLTYCALNSMEKQFNLRQVACVNPRRATYFRVDLETLCLQLCRKPSDELLSEIVYYLSSGDISR
jgi:hypothetical protein